MIHRLSMLAVLLPFPLWAGQVFDVNFTAAEGFSDGQQIAGVNSMAGQALWVAEDVDGAGVAVGSGAWERAEHFAGFQLEIGHSVVIETTLRLTDGDGVFTNGEFARVGFAEQSLHSGNSIPSIGSILSSSLDGSYWFGADQAGQRIEVPAAAAGDWITFTQTITRSAATNQFSGRVAAYNETTGEHLGEIAAAWLQSTDDGSWGGGMNASFRILANGGGSTLEIDRFRVSTTVPKEPVHFLVDPEVSVSIDGHLELDRKKYISLSDPGRRAESTISDATRTNEYLGNLGIGFGRELGGAYAVTGWNTAAVQADPDRPGHVDIDNLIANVNPDNGGTSQEVMDHLGPNLDVAAHDRYGAYPDFMELWFAEGDDPSHLYPVNVDAGAEYVAAVLQYNYTDWTRPATYEIINEPNWRLWGDQRFADLHTAVNRKVDDAGLDVAVGGPCMAVGYFYKNRYQHSGLKPFIDNTGCELDFYSFHVYDFMHWDEGVQDFRGRVSTGLPIEGVLDLVQSQTRKEYGKGVDMVLSEHGGYISTDQELALDTVANTYFPGSGFDWEMKRRSVSEHLAVSSAIANTMAFMNNPHVIRKAVPFILMESAAWNTRYYSTLLVKEDFDKNSDVWHESQYINFYKFFQKVSGRRILVSGGDPDIQLQAYENDGTVFVLANNLATQPEELAINLPTSGIQGITLRRFGRNADYTPFFEEVGMTTLEGLHLGSREAIALEIRYASPFGECERLDEVPYYADVHQQEINQPELVGSRMFRITLPEHELARSAQLRIGVGRDSGTDRDLEVVFNGAGLEVPMEDCAAYLESGEYGSTKLIDLPANLLQENNTIEVSFPDNGAGGIGAVVLRARLVQSLEAPVLAVNCADVETISDDGTSYGDDSYYTTSSTGTDTKTEFGNTDDHPLYRKERWGPDFSYGFPVPNGDYEVMLHFAENWFDEPDQRIFDVAIEDERVLSGLDLFAVAGRGNAYDRRFVARVSDGELNVDFHATKNNAKINAIRITPLPPVRVGITYSEWARQMGLAGPEAARSLDLDGDGLSNEEEFAAGTDPSDRNSDHRASVEARPGGIAVMINSKAGRSYTVETSEDLSGDWTEWTTGVTGTGEMLEVIDTSGAGNCFYRVRVGVE